MNCDDLKPMFDANPRLQDFAEQVDLVCPDCQCEMSSVSAFSQGNPVQDSETLLKIITTDEVKRTGTPEFYDTSFLPLIGSGLSVLREAMASSNEIRSLAEDLARKRASKRPDSERVEIWGVIRFKAGDVRARRLQAETNSGRKTFCIYETPEENLPSHADVLLAAACISGTNKRRKEAFNLARQFERGGCSVPADKYTGADLKGIVFQGAGIANSDHSD